MVILRDTDRKKNIKRKFSRKSPYLAISLTDFDDLFTDVESSAKNGNHQRFSFFEPQICLVAILEQWYLGGATYEAKIENYRSAKIFKKTIFLGVFLCEKSIARIPEAWKLIF